MGPLKTMETALWACAFVVGFVFFYRMSSRAVKRCAEQQARILRDEEARPLRASETALLLPLSRG